MECLIEHVEFGFALLVEVVVTLHIYLTGGAERHTAAGALDAEVIHPAYLHEVEVHVGGSINDVGCTLPIYYGH